MASSPVREAAAPTTTTSASTPSSPTNNPTNPYSSRHVKAGERPVWSSRSAFSLTLLGVLLSQFWRGTTLVARTNVWASLLALLMSFGVIGLPVLLLELGLGQGYQVGPIGIWQLPQLLCGKRRPGVWTGLGVAGLLVGLLSAALSAGLLGWTVHALVDSFHVGKEVVTGEYWVESIVGHIYDENKKGQRHLPLEITLDWNNVGYLVLIWVCVGAIAGLGARHMGRILLVLTSGSLVLLLVLAIASFCVQEMKDPESTSEDTVDAWEDFGNAVDHGDVLSEAIIQTLFILSLAVGIQSAYASYAPARGEPTAKMACAAVGINLVVLIVVGYCVEFSIEKTAPLHKYYLPNIMWETVVSVLWVQWPAALGTLPGGIHWVRLVYAVLLLLIIQLPTAVVTAFLTVLHEDRTTGIRSRWKIAALVSTLGFLASLPFATSAGLVFIDSMDYYLSLTLLLIGILETFAAGWMYNLDEQIHHFGKTPIVFCILWNFAPVTIAAFVWFGFDNAPPDAKASELDAAHYQRMWIGLFGGLAAFLIFFAICFVSVRRSYERYMERFYARGGNTAAGGNEDPPMLHPRDYYLEFCFGNVEALKGNLEPSLGRKLPQVWYIFLKRVVPHLMLLVFIKRLLMIQANEDHITFGRYGEYPIIPYQLYGLIVFGGIVGVFVLGLIYPAIYAPLVPPPTSIFINRRDTMEEEDVEEGTGNETESSASEAPPIEVLPDMEDPEDIMDGIQRVDMH